MTEYFTYFYLLYIYIIICDHTQSDLLDIGARVIEVNDVECIALTHSEIVNMIKAAGRPLRIGFCIQDLALYAQGPPPPDAPEVTEIGSYCFLLFYC